MAENTIAQAYVQIVPSAKGIQGKLAEQFSGEGESIANSLMGKIKSALMAAGIGTAVAATIKSAISEGAALEQSLGGIDTLFKGSAEKVKTYAREAFSSAGMSANEYMENVTSFSAGLIASCGGDTAKAAEIANTAMIDMSDNANKMGSNMQDIQNAYQGFAKQNYTMLDNLKLGYGGTKTEMERLLADATKLTGVKYDINNLSDVYNAIHAIQENIGITGTTAEEAAKTFGGSFSAMKAAAKNLLGYMADGSSQQYVAQALADLLDSTSTFLFDNAIPMLGRFIEMVPGVIARGLNGLRTKLSEAGAEGIGGFISGFVREIPAVIEAVVRLAAEIVKYFIRNKDQFKQMAHECVVAFVDGLAEIIPMSEETIKNLPQVIETAVKAFAGLKIASLVAGPLMQFGSAIMSIGPKLASLGSGIVGIIRNTKSFSGAFSLLKYAFSSLISPVGLVVAVIAVLGGAFMTLWNNSEEFRTNITETFNGLVENFNNFVQGIVDRINALGFDFENFGEMVSAVWNGFCEMLAPVFEGAWTAICGFLSGVFDVITGLLDFFIGLFSGNWEQCWLGVQEIAGGIWDAICGVFQGAFDAVMGLLDWFCGLFGTDWQTVWTNCQNTASSIWDGIKSTLSNIWNGIKDSASNIFNSVKDAISQKFQEAKDKVASIWNGAKSTLSGIWNGIVNTARNIFGGIYDAIVGPFQRAKSAVESIWNWISGHSEVNVKVNQSGGGNSGSVSVPHAAGGVFTRATLIPSIYGGNHIVGEAGPEAILPLTEFYKAMDKSIQQGYKNGFSDEKLSAVIELLAYIADKPSYMVMDKKIVGKMVASEVQGAVAKQDKLRSRLGGVTG